MCPSFFTLGRSRRAGARRATWISHLYVDSFVQDWVERFDHRRAPGSPRPRLTWEIRRPIEQMLRLVVPGFVGHTRHRVPPEPFADRVPGFFAYLRHERGLRDETVAHYGHHLRQLDKYLREIGLEDLHALSPVVVSGFLTDRSRDLQRTGVRDRCGVLRVFIRYLYRQGLLTRDWSGTVEAAPVYRLATIPRSITWDEVRRMLDTVDRRTIVGRRDYAMLLLLVSYGLRAREVAALTLGDLDWPHDRLRVPERKAGHSTAYPLSPLVGHAILEYLKAGRPTTSSRRIFFRYAGAVRAHHPFGRLMPGRALPAPSRDHRPTPRIPYAATHLRAAPRGCGLAVEADRRLRRPPQSRLDGDLQQSRHRSLA